jgi:non-specific serine/threonine protein kinase
LVIAIVAVAAVFLIRMPRRATVPEEKSIAVLPFVDMSPQHDQAYFCDGMTEDIITKLSSIGNLRVISRTSAMRYKNTDKSAKEIGQELRVGAILEGSIQKEKDRVRINAQLIGTAHETHLWADRFDRQLESVFDIQDEISSAIANALQMRLTPQEREKMTEHPIDNVKAYECYLKAMHQILRFDEKSLDSAFVSLQTGIDIMGDNAQLYSGMASAYSMYANIGMGQEEYLNRAKEYAHKALTLKPELPSALGTLGVLSIYEDYPRNSQDGFRYYKRGLAANPNDGEVLDVLAGLYQIIGKPSEASAIVERLASVDPLNDRLHLRRGFGYQYDCQFGPALEEFRMYYEADSTNRIAQAVYSMALASNAKRDEALTVIGRIGTASAGNVLCRISLLLKYALLKDKESALRLLTPEFEKTCRRDYEWSYWVADGLSLLGAKEEALDWLANAVRRGWINYPLLQCDPLLASIRGEERFGKLMEHAKYEWEHFEVPE